MTEPWQRTEDRYLEETAGDEEETAVVMRQGNVNTDFVEYMIDDDPWRWSVSQDEAWFMTPTRAAENRRLLKRHCPGFDYVVLDHAVKES